MQLIAEMLGVSPDTIPWQARPITYIEFQSTEQLYRAVLAFVEAQQALYRTTVAELAARHLLTPSEAQQSLPELYLSVDDARSPRTRFSLPPNLPPHVKWFMEP